MDGICTSTRHTVGDDAAINTVGVYDIAAAEFLPGEIQLPYQVLHFGPVTGGGGVYFVLSGRLGEGLGYLESATGAEPQWVHRYPAGDPMRFNLAGSAAHPTESMVYVVTKAGLIQRWWPLTRQLAPPVGIGMPEKLAIPMQHVIATASGLLLLGVSDRETASCGLSAGILEFGLEDGFGGDPRRAWKLEPLAEKILATKDGKSLLGLSRLDRSLSVYDVESGERVGYLGGIGVAPMAVAGAAIAQ